ncbi:MAG: DUF2971 domain-containing protein [Bacteroidota bacterium]|nr:DUF2971 domain-containing protein [Bacteroidota bacterium]
MSSYKNIDLKFNLKGIEDFPPILYKFRNWDNSYHQNLLTHQELFISNVEALNDPFDGSIVVNLNSKSVSKKDLRNLLGIKDNLSIPLDIILEKAIKNFDMKLNAQIKISVQNTGVICFSSSKNNILLWSHYANGHTGFAVGFDTQKLTKAIGELKLESFIKEIFYSDTYPEINFEYDILKHRDVTLLFKAIIESLVTKSSLWSYEDEVRILTFAKNKLLVQFPKDCVSEILIGFKMNDKRVAEIIDIGKNLYPEAEILRCVKEPKTYSISFERLT